MREGEEEGVAGGDWIELEIEKMKTRDLL